MSDQAERAREAVSRARVGLLLRQPFFGYLALRLEVVVDEEIPTLAVDSQHLYINPAFVLAQTPEHLLMIVAHETLHICLRHSLRRGARDHALFNIAGDAVINILLRDAGFAIPPSAILWPEYAGMATEEVYERLKTDDNRVRPVQVIIGAGGSDYGGTGSVLDDVTADGGALSEAEREARARDWQVATAQAAQAAKAQGNPPGCLEQFAEGITRPQIDWREALRAFVRVTTAASDYSWRRGNPRFLATGDYLPSLYDERCGPLVFGVDTSGSVSDRELQAICAELNAALDTARPESVHVVYCDAEVAGAELFTPDEYPVRMAVKGRGGTHLAPIWDYVRRECLEPVCGILATDMELSVADLGADPGFPVLMLTTGRDAPYDGAPTFGIVLKVTA